MTPAVRGPGAGHCHRRGPAPGAVNWAWSRAWPRHGQRQHALHAWCSAFRRGVPEINVTSSLQGMAAGNLPAPLAKSCRVSSLPLRVDNSLARESLTRAVAASDVRSRPFVTQDHAGPWSWAAWLVRGVRARHQRARSRGCCAAPSAWACCIRRVGAACPMEGVTANIQHRLGAGHRCLGGHLRSACRSRPRPCATARVPACCRERCTLTRPRRSRPSCPTALALRATGPVHGVAAQLHYLTVGGSQRDGPTWKRQPRCGASSMAIVEYRQPAGGGAGNGRLFAQPVARVTIAAKRCRGRGRNPARPAQPTVAAGAGRGDRRFRPARQKARPPGDGGREPRRRRGRAGAACASGG